MAPDSGGKRKPADGLDPVPEDPGGVKDRVEQGLKMLEQLRQS
jgi:hypothetical protein